MHNDLLQEYQDSILTAANEYDARAAVGWRASFALGFRPGLLRILCSPGLALDSVRAAADVATRAESAWH
jgi:hypothetical protein